MGFVGNVAGSLATSYIGNKNYLGKKELLKYINALLK
jgi:hypothetical protein